MYEKELFFITKATSLEAVVKEESMNYLPRTLALVVSWEEGKGKGKGSTALLIVLGLRDWKDARRMCLPLLVILHTAASPSVQLIGIQSRAGSMRERWWWWWWWWGGGGGGGSCCLSPATFTARWELTVEPASETDTLSLVKWTVTLHFSTSWQHRIGRFEPCDVTLIEFWFYSATPQPGL